MPFGPRLLPPGAALLSSLPLLGLLVLLALCSPVPSSAFLLPGTSSTVSRHIRQAIKATPASLSSQITMAAATLEAPAEPTSPPQQLADVSLKPYLERLLGGGTLSSTDVEAAFDRILAGADPIQVSALLVMLRQRGETPAEIAGMVRAMKKACRPIHVGGKLLDIVGTGGDGAHTINISTAAIILAAACGCKAAKLGNRSVSSKCGSADVLEALGINVELEPDEVASCIEETGVGFMFAPVVHPAMRKVAPIRRALGVRTAFNIVGPLLNTAGAQCIVIGVFHEELLDLLANTLITMGTVEVALIIHGAGLDEISPLGRSKIIEVRNTNVNSPGPKKYEKKVYELDPESLGVPTCTIEDLKGGDASENAAMLREVLSGGDHRNAKRDAVVLNAAAGLYVYGMVSDFKEGVTKAYQVLSSGKAITKLDQWIACSQRLSSGQQSTGGAAP